jgi:predicted alpha/beta superfamily hydrolase
MSIRNRLLKFSSIAALVFALQPATKPHAQDEESQPLVLGRVTTVYSRILGEERTILLDLPAGYEFTQTRFPVLFVLDGLRNFQHATASVDFLSSNGRIPQMIVVGIPSTAPNRDLTPTHVADEEMSGAADTFLEFLEEELIPYMDENYRTQPLRVLFGHSLSGMFTVYALLTKPDVFDGYIAASPQLNWDDEHVVSVAKDALTRRSAKAKSLFLALGDEPDYAGAMKRLTRVLKGANNSGLSWKYVAMEDDDHMSTPLKTLYQGLEMAFSSWRYPGDLSEADVPSIQAHYEKLSKEMGYEIPIPEGLLNQLGYLLLMDERNDDAIAAFNLNIKNYPGSANVYDSLGEAYEAMGEWGLARVNYEKAYRRGLEIEDPNTEIYKEHLDNLLERLSEFD